LPEATLAIAPRKSARTPVVPASARSEDTDRFSLARRSYAPLHPGETKEVREQLMPVFRGDTFGMELHAVHRVARVLQAHDHTVRRFCGDLERIRQACPLHDERMVAGSGEILRDVGEHTLSGVMHLGELAMHQRWCTHHAAAIDLANRLVAETHAE